MVCVCACVHVLGYFCICLPSLHCTQHMWVHRVCDSYGTWCVCVCVCVCMRIFSTKLFIDGMTGVVKSLVDGNGGGCVCVCASSLSQMG